MPLIPAFLFSVSMALAFASSAHAEIRVLTSIKPLQLIAAAVQDGVGTPDVLLPPGASPHHFTLLEGSGRCVGQTLTLTQP